MDVIYFLHYFLTVDCDTYSAICSHLAHSHVNYKPHKFWFSGLSLPGFGTVVDNIKKLDGEFHRSMPDGSYKRWDVDTTYGHPTITGSTRVCDHSWNVGGRDVDTDVRFDPNHLLRNELIAHNKSTDPADRLSLWDTSQPGIPVEVSPSEVHQGDIVHVDVGASIIPLPSVRGDCHVLALNVRSLSVLFRRHDYVSDGL